MKKINIVVLSPSNIAFRRTVPAFLKSDYFNYIGVAHANKKEWGDDSYANVFEEETKKCELFIKTFGGRIFDSFLSAFKCPQVDAIYIPLPPSIHKKWAMKALKYNKHVILEKPLTTSYEDTKNLINLASQKGLIIHENYAFMYHKQIKMLEGIVKEKRIGDLRFIRASFSFPYRGENDFRYHKSLGGGAIIDCGGYPLKIATHFLGNDYELVCSNIFKAKGHDVDIYGSATLKNSNVCAQVFWGMDNAYQCKVELFGSLGYIFTERVFSPTSEMEIMINQNINGSISQIIISPDDQFLKSVDYFARCVFGYEKEDYESIVRQSKLIDCIKKG